MFVMVFALAVGGAATFFNETAYNYGVTLQPNVSSSYDNIQEYYANLESIEGQVQGSDSAATETTDANFITSVKSMWSSVQLFFNSLGFATDLANNAGEDLGIPAPVVGVVIGLVLLSFLALIFSIAVRWKSN